MIEDESEEDEDDDDDDDEDNVGDDGRAHLAALLTGLCMCTQCQTTRAN